MQKAKKKELYRNCDPYKIEEKHRINIDQFYTDERVLRGCNWAEKLADTISFGDGSTLQLFTGYSGSGKTTELKSVQEILEKENYEVVYIDADNYIDMTKEIELVDIYSSILFSVVKQLNGGKFKKDGYFKRIENFVTNELSIKDFKIEGFTIEMKDTPSVREKVATHIKDNFSSFKQNLKDELYNLNEKIKDDGKEGIVVILDSLEKNKGITFEYENVIKASEILFSNRDNLTMPIDIIYTVPTFLSERVRLIDIDFLPAIKVKDKDNQDFEKGIKLLQELVYKRVSKDDLLAIMGDDYENQLIKLIKFSGGYVRDLLKLLRDIIIQKNYPVEDDTIDRIIYNEINTFQELLNLKIIDELKKVDENKNIQGIADIKIKDQLLTNHLILRYQNQYLWFDIHPAISELLK